MQKQVDGIDQRFAGFAHLNEGDAHQNRNQNDLKHDAIRECANEGTRDYVEKEIDCSALLTGGLAVLGDSAGIKRGSVDIHPSAWLCDIDHNKADDQRNG
ncbi:hypothetical protein D3C73_941450 [compost metagenome]